MKLRSELERRLLWILDHPSGSLARVDIPLELFMRQAWVKGASAVNVQETSKLSLALHITPAATAKVIVLIHNNGRHSLAAGEWQIAFVFHSSIDIEDEHGQRLHDIFTPDGKVMYIADNLPKLFPDGWFKIPLTLSARNKIVDGTEVPMTIRVLTQLGARDYPLQLVFYSEKAIRE